jgi:hypothetical protein
MSEDSESYPFSFVKLPQGKRPYRYIKIILVVITGFLEVSTSLHYAWIEVDKFNRNPEFDVLV